MVESIDSVVAEVLRSLRPLSLVTLADGRPALVMCQLREHVTVLVGRVVLVVERWMVVS